MTENKMIPNFKFNNTEINGQSETNYVPTDYSHNKIKSKKEKKIQNLKNLKSYLENNKNENLESLENKNELRENHRQQLITEAQELNVKKNQNFSQEKNENANKLALPEFKNKTDLMKINDLEQLSKLLKKEIERQKKTKWFKIKKFFEKILDSNIYIIFTMVITIFILFISDIQNGWLQETIDKPVEIMQTVIFCLYLLEIIITSICKQGYINSFFFWLDILSTVYIIQDISFIINPILGLDNSIL